LNEHFWKYFGQQPTQLLMPTRKIIELKKSPATKIYANAQNALAFFYNLTKPKAEKK
jgi:hypothetical protein